ncbi:hypothetical protein V5799_014666, partial [Amblyomma americanum]
LVISRGRVHVEGQRQQRGALRGGTWRQWWWQRWCGPRGEGARQLGSGVHGSVELPASQPPHCALCLLFRPLQ